MKLRFLRTCVMAMVVGLAQAGCDDGVDTDDLTDNENEIQEITRAGGRMLDMLITDQGLMPDRVFVAPAERFVLMLINDTTQEHSITMDRVGRGTTSLKSGWSVFVPVTAPAASGEYIFTVGQHRGTIVVRGGDVPGGTR